MGFGILLLGYFLTFAFSLSKVYFFADVIGALVMLYAFAKLSEYNLCFQWASFAGIAFTLLALGNAFCITMQMVTAEGWLDIVLDAAKSVAALVLQICMLLGIRGISQGAEYEKLARKAARNIGMLGVYYVLYFLVLLTAPLYPENVSYVSFIVYLYWFVCFICNLLLIHSSFGMFYPAEGDPMENRRSKIPLFNKISDAFDRLEEKTNRYREESMKMALEEAEKKAAEKNRHKKKKKRK